MGVSCNAYEHVTLVKACPANSMSEDDWDRLYDNGERFLDNLEGFVERGDGLPEGIYKATGDSDGVERSYGGYGAFREAVCKAIHGVEPRVVWDNPDDYVGKPFYEWIDFADNEGFLGPKVCTKLAADFAQHRETVIAALTHEFDRSYYDGWVKLTRVAASGDGVIVYS